MWLFVNEYNGLVISLMIFLKYSIMPNASYINCSYKWELSGVDGSYNLYIYIAKR